MSKRKELRIAFSTQELLEIMLPTPLVRLKNVSKDNAELWAKLEYLNPYSNSVKDRPAHKLLFTTTTKEKITELMEASSGNFSIALTLLANTLGIKTTIFLPKPTPKSTEILLKAFGANVIRTEFETISKEMVDYVKEIANREGKTNLNQFENDLNFQMHYETTARELYQQILHAKINPDYLIIGVGTSGTIAAITKYFHEKNMNIKIIGVQPAKGEKIPGIKRLETQPKWIFKYKPDEMIDITRKQAIDGVLEIARKEGLPIGLSSGAVYHAYTLLSKNNPGTYITIFPDHTYKYTEALEKILT